MIKVITIRFVFLSLIFASTQGFSKVPIETYFGFDVAVFSIGDIDNRTQSEVEKCIDYLEGKSWEKHKDYTLKALELEFGYPAIVINYNDKFNIQKSKKLAALYKAAFSCYEPAYDMVFRFELDNKNKDALLWALLISQNTGKYEGQEPHRGLTNQILEFSQKEKIDSIQFEDLFSFFGRFDCTARRK